MTTAVPLIAAALLLLSPPLDAARQSLSLDGEWRLQLQSGSNQSGSIQVPGSWEAQGFGTETVQMHHQVVTGDIAHGARGVVGVYTKKIKMPKQCPAGHKAFFMVDQGIHRHALFSAGLITQGVPGVPLDAFAPP
jgi:hypothetical protein